LFSRSINDTPRVIRMMVLGDATTWSVILMTRVVIYDRNSSFIEVSNTTKNMASGNADHRILIKMFMV
jgi:hypothetical protein